MNREFAIDDLIKVAKRENNTKRSYLYVNPLQGKHIPVSPSVSLELFDQMADMVERRYGGRRLLVIGFAETATAIGASIAYKAENVKYYLSTTREDVAGADYLLFTESHSHAAQQRLVKDKLEEIISDIDGIVFAEDEVTTGNTIEKLITEMKKTWDCSGCLFGIVSILNSMPWERLAGLMEKGIACDFIQRIPFQYRINDIERYQYKPLRSSIESGRIGDYARIAIEDYWNPRIAASTAVMKTKIVSFLTKTMNSIAWPEFPETVLVVGTEEFMFPAMMLGKMIEEKFQDVSVRFHATTRSPIEISDGEDYPLHTREPLNSLYEDGRYTYIYNLERYDRVIVATDANPVNESGLSSLLKALEDAGNTEISIVQWKDDTDEKQLFT